MADVDAKLGLGGQLRMVAWLRWRILRNSVSNKNRRLDMIGLVFSGLFSVLFVAAATVGFFWGTQYLFARHLERLLSLLFLLLLVWWQLFPIMLAGFAPQFSFRSLLRFPMNLGSFYLIGLAYGLADSAAVAAIVWMGAMVAATAFARPMALPAMLVACLLFVLMNITIERLIGAWLEKLLAKRRTREIIFTLFILSMISLQFLNPLMQKYGKTLVPMVQGWLPYLSVLPSSFAGNAVAQFSEHNWMMALTSLIGLTAYMVLFSYLLLTRYRKLYAGEELSEGAAPQKKEKRVEEAADDGTESLAFLPTQVRAVFRKELLYLKRNTFLFFGLIFPPMFMLFISFQLTSMGKNGPHKGFSPDMLFPGMMAYLVLILIAPSYNSFAYEGKGIQSYFLAPTRFREILIAKNLMTVAILSIEVLLCICLMGWRVGFPGTPILAATIAALAFSIAGQLTIANWTSLSFPRKIEFGKMQGQRNSGMSVLVLLGVQILFGGVSATVLLSGRWSGNIWLPAEIFVLLAAVAIGGYFSALEAFTQLAERKKETLIDALCR